MLKRIVSFTLALLLVGTVFVGCKQDEQPALSEEPIASSEQETPSSESPENEETESEQPEQAEEETEVSDEIRVGAMKGPTTMGMVKLMQDAEDGATKHDYDFTITTIDDIVPQVAKGELDIAAVPANLSSVLYNNTEGGIQVAAINTLGVIYIVEQGDSIKTVEDLKGKTLYSTGKGATPEFSLNYVLAQHGMDPETDLTVEYKSEAAEIIPLLLQNPEAIAMLPQPFVTVAEQKVEGLQIALDWTKEWEAVAEGESSMLTGVLIVQKEFAEKYPNVLEDFLTEYQASTKYTESNVTETAELIEKYGIVDAAIAEKALPFSNITYIAGEDMKHDLQGYLQVLFEQEPKSVGGALPDEDYYYLSGN